MADSGGGRFALGIEMLTGLAIGAAALAAFVSFALAMLNWNRLRGEVGARAQFTASMVAQSMGGSPTRAAFGEAVKGIPSMGGLRAVALVDSGGGVLEAVGEAATFPEPGKGSWFTVPVGAGELSVAVRPDYGSVPGPWLPLGLGALAGGLTVLALLAPGHLRKRVLEPLRSILEEAESFSPGDGRNARTASDSYRRLVERLSDRERTLSRLREEAERRADIVESRSRAILQAMGSAVLTLDAGGRLGMCNPPARGTVVAADAEDGDPFEEVALPLGREVVGRHPPGSEEDAAFQLECGSGRGRRILSVTASTTADGEVAYLITDVTGAAEMERRVAEEKAMADLGAVSAGVSHEMGNSLCAIGGFLDLLARGPLGERESNVLQEARMEVASARRMVESFRSLAGPSGAELEPMGPGELADLVRSECRQMGARFRNLLGPRPAALLESRPELLRRCLRNLLKNAREAGGDGEVEVELALKEGRLALSVADRGAGLPPDRERLFSPFFTTKEDADGGNMGLGLTITRRIVAVMGGEIEAFDREGGGAVFRMVIPLSEGG
jgi:signal transduction histidine kinase